MRKLIEPKIVIATHNMGKLKEIQSLIHPFNKTCVSAGELGFDEPEETENTFVGNAKIKAHYAAKQSGLPALSDDSGIMVSALNGAPGVYTADWAETPAGRDFDIAMQRVWNEVQSSRATAPFTAKFVCTLCLAWPDGEDAIFEGVAKGHVVWPKRGRNGFGFDPMFVPNGYDITFGEMLPEQKQPLTHRAHAFSLFVSGCLND